MYPWGDSNSQILPCCWRGVMSSVGQTENKFWSEVSEGWFRKFPLKSKVSHEVTAALPAAPCAVWACSAAPCCWGWVGRSWRRFVRRREDGSSSSCKQCAQLWLWVTHRLLLFHLEMKWFHPDLSLFFRITVRRTDGGCRRCESGIGTALQEKHIYIF